ncbi:protein-S-isoprenylcysteine methyltransferase [Actinobacillus equuli]|nr:protein-S-isoprenylcysteine methyltransferase [Actinobacillus equuli]
MVYRKRLFLAEIDIMELKLPPPLLFAFCLLLIYLLPRGEHYPLPQWLSILFAGVGIAVSMAGFML